MLKVDGNNLIISSADKDTEIIISLVDEYVFSDIDREIIINAIKENDQKISDLKFTNYML